MSKKILILLIICLLVGCDADSNKTSNSENININEIILEDESNFEPVDSMDVHSLTSNKDEPMINKETSEIAENNHQTFETESTVETTATDKDSKEVVAPELDIDFTMKDENIDKYWDTSDKYSYDEDGLLHIAPFIKNKVVINSHVISQYNEQLQAYNSILTEMESGKSYDDLSEEAAEIFNQFDMGLTPWFVGEFCGWYCVNWFEEASASSTLHSTDKKYQIENITNEYIDSCWAEGAEGDGIGEYFTLKANTKYVPRLFALYNGYLKSDETFYDNNRIKSLLLYINDKPFAVFELEDTMDEQIFLINRLEKLDENFELKFEILSVYDGLLYDDTCLSGIQIRDGH